MPEKRQVFYSFHYEPDSWRTSTVRSIGAIEGNKVVSDNDWEEVTGGGPEAIKKWIADQMKYRSCTIVLIGEKTAGRKWINHEIIESWDSKMGVVGIYIHGLKNKDGYISNKGTNPFEKINYGERKLSSVVDCYNPVGSNSKERYDWISKNIVSIVEKAIKTRNDN